MSRRLTPEQRQAKAIADMAQARRDSAQAQLDGFAAIADGRKLHRDIGQGIRSVIKVGDVFGWDIDHIERLVRAVAVQFTTDAKPPIADVLEAGDAAQEVAS